MITMLKSLYMSIKACVRLTSNMSYSELFEISLGLKQGEPLSPLLFILFINDITEHIDFDNLSESDIDQLSIYMLLFADDIALFTTSPVSLQAQLDSISNYSTACGLKINVNKTKICVFEKRRRQNNYVFYIYGQQVEIVDSFCYLGIKFYYTGNMRYAIKALSDQALKAYHSLLCLFNNIKLDVKTKLSLFDALVVPILLYGSEIWGIYNYKDIDNLHCKFLKIILGVKQSTPNVAVLGETGRYPLSVLCKERSIIYWLKL